MTSSASMGSALSESDIERRPPSPRDTRRSLFRVELAQHCCCETLKRREPLEREIKSHWMHAYFVALLPCGHSSQQGKQAYIWSKERVPWKRKEFFLILILTLILIHSYKHSLKLLTIMVRYTTRACMWWYANKLMLAASERIDNDEREAIGLIIVIVVVRMTLIMMTHSSSSQYSDSVEFLSLSLYHQE